MSEPSKLPNFLLIILFASGIVLIGSHELRQRFYAEGELSVEEVNDRLSTLRNEDSLMEKARLSPQAMQELGDQTAKRKEEFKEQDSGGPEKEDQKKLNQLIEKITSPKETK